MEQLSLRELAVYRARLRGCLLGGAIGDALGHPIEGLSLPGIRARYGEHGVTGPVPDLDGVTGRISDETQLTLFTAEGWLSAYARAMARGLGGAETAMVHDAYQAWQETQTYPEPPPRDGLRHRSGRLREERWLYARRGPGPATAAGLRESHVPVPWIPVDGTPGPVNPDSKGCGAVVRSAPFGFTGSDPKWCFELAARCAQITHGHPTGYYAAGAFAAMISHLVNGGSVEAAVLMSMELLAGYPGHEETTAALRRAVDLARTGPATPSKVESLGAGWIAEEALAVGLYTALAPTEYREDRTPVEIALLTAVNHSGDSDSTGSVCGNLLGAHYGDCLLPAHWLQQIEGRAVIAALADDFAAEVHPGESRPWLYH
ncbi:ADP-ribosylglycohydrolase family protein [Kitasatospora sp. NBC_00240]|uniref:ADP-ribosylglycohydrolase family protein n=1 Tax=Kitasatospora sp. NBC_00240 TaxID=2903567 RepID=UPI0022597405|nr:ADP-ribosylglycohydrolase family protein [Kitasatospora sp. NBC_00240]MCX5209100.1 ADP-ribosylglycohydrolase family protein [Kitasatospora sp. NBC_00240]